MFPKSSLKIYYYNYYSVIDQSHVMFMFIYEFLTVHIAQQSNTEVAMTTYTCNTHTHPYKHTQFYTYIHLLDISTTSKYIFVE